MTPEQLLAIQQQLHMTAVDTMYALGFAFLLVMGFMLLAAWSALRN